MFLQKTQKGVASCKAEFCMRRESRMDKWTKLRMGGGSLALSYRKDTFGFILLFVTEPKRGYINKGLDKSTRI
jgi:hypothetical protein